MPQQAQQGGGMYGQQQQQQQPMQGGMMPYGQQTPPQQGMMPYGAPPQQQQQQAPPNQMMMSSQSMVGGFGMNSSLNNMNSNGAPPPPNNGMNGSMNGMAPPMQQLMNQPSAQNAMAGALVPSNMQSNPYALGPAATGGANPFGAPALGAPPQQQQLQQPPNANPFGAPALGAPQQHQRLGAPQGNQMVAMDPFAAPAPPALAQQPPPQLAADPWGAQPPQQPIQSHALVPSAPSNDPFGMFTGGPVGGPSVAPSMPPSAMGAPPSVYPSGGTVVPPQQPPQQQPQPPGGDDPWDMFGTPDPAPAPSGPVPGEDDNLFHAGLQPTGDEAKGSAPAPPKPPSSPPKSSSSGKRKKGELPPGGEWYDAKIFTPTLGVMFFKPKELVDSLFLSTDKKLVESLEERPVVAFIVEGSSARSAGVELGHVLLKVNGIDVKNPKEASRLIKEGPRPLPLLFYVPDTSVVVSEGEHMVKYDTRETVAPASAKDWKPKYVVIGGIIAQPWMMNMYRSKSEYDIAVIETQARRPVSVKVKQFSLQGARIQHDWQGPQMVKYKNKLHPWKFIVVLPVSRNPIKISSTNLSQLKPVHEGIRRVLQAQQRGNTPGVKGPTAAPVKTNDPYENGSAPSGRMPSEGGVGSARRKTAY